MPVIDAAELAAKLASDSPPTLLDVRWKLGAPSAYPEYLAGRLPGAVFIDLGAELCGEPGPGGRHPLPSPAALQAVLRSAGVRQDREVVVYDLGDGMAAARAWWTLRWAGHPGVWVLAGGYPTWTGPVDTGQPGPPEPGDFEVRPGGLPVLTADEAASLAREGVLLDARAAERYRGVNEPIDAVAGHIPGAISLPHGSTGLPLSAARIGAYCGSGITAAHTILALHQAGREDAALYVGSWSHWITDPRRPVATGDQP